MLYFMHIPKTAVTSLRRLLSEHVFQDRLRPIYHDLGYWNADDERASLRGDEVFYGHFCHGVHRLLHDPAPLYFTFLRHPVERVISYYRHCRAFVLGQPGIDSRRFSLREFVERGCSHETNNHMVRMLAANYSRTHRGIYHASNWYARRFQGRETYQIHRQRHLARALDHLRRDFRFVGLTEHFAPGVEHLLRLFGAPVHSLEIPWNNAAVEPLPTPLDAPTRAAIAAANDLDLALYRTVVHDPVRHHAVVPSPCHVAA